MLNHCPDPELVVHTARQARRFTPVLFVAQAVAVAALWGHVERGPLLIWLAVAALNGIRMFVANHLEIRRFSAHGVDPHFVVRNIVHGVAGAAVWGVLPPIAGRYGDDWAILLAFLVVIGMSFGVVYGTAASQLNFISAMVGFVSPTVIATVVGIIDPSWMSLLFVAFTAMLVAIHRALYRLVMEHTEATAQNRALADQLADALATVDPITSAVNRVGLERWLAIRPETDLNVLVVVVDRLDETRWLFGHDAGDELLRQFSHRITGAVDDDTVFVRLSDREFALVSESSLSLSDVVSDATADTVSMAGLKVEIPVRSAAHRCDPQSVELVVTDLGNRLRRQHASRTSSDLLGVPDGIQRELLGEIPAALADGSIGPWFQPVVDIASGEVSGWEALLRWVHPRHGVVSPAALLPLAVASGYMSDVTRRMLDGSLEFVADLLADGRDRAAKVHVNIEPSDVGAHFEADLVVLLGRHEVPADRLVLEITERTLIEIDDELVAVLTALRRRGVQIAIDDFGTGFSSLSHLLDFPVDCVKIDQRFIADMQDHESSRLLVRAVLGLAHGLGFGTVAEGVEVPCQAEMLGELGCGEYQGFLVSPAIPAADAFALLDRRSAERANPHTVAPASAARE